MRIYHYDYVITFSVTSDSPNTEPEPENVLEALQQKMTEELRDIKENPKDWKSFLKNFPPEEIEES